MKKYFGMLLAMVIAVLPFTVEAASVSVENQSCDENNVCSGTIVLKNDSPVPLVEVTLTEKGGAKILNVTALAPFTKTSENGLVYTFAYADGNPIGAVEEDLFTVSYQATGSEDCGITINGISFPASSKDTDTPTENKQTGSTLPFIAIGAIALVAVGAYAATRNKAKMYKI